MSLLDALLRDAPLATVVQSDVWFAIRQDGARGSGKQDDPYDGSTAAAFDSVMASLASNRNLTIHLINVGTPDHAVYHTNSGAVSPFNNQTNAGAFRPGYDGTTGLHDAELTTDVEDVILGV